MKNIQLEKNTNTHKISFLITALAFSLTIQLLAQNAYPTFEKPAHQSNVQALADFPEIV